MYIKNIRRKSNLKSAFRTNQFIKKIVGKKKYIKLGFCKKILDAKILNAYPKIKNSINVLIKYIIIAPRSRDSFVTGIVNLPPLLLADFSFLLGKSKFVDL